MNYRKGFQITYSYDNNFVELMERLQRKYSHKLFTMSGIGDQLDLHKLSKDFFTNKTTTADVSVDSNANVGDMSVINYTIESNKPSQLLNSYYRLWKQLSKSRSIEYANRLIERQLTGDIYINDFHGVSSARNYCFNYSAYDTALNGIPRELDAKGEAKPPQYLQSFISQIELFCLIAGNSTLGAVGLNDCLLVMSLYFNRVLDKMGDSHFKFNSENDCWLYLREKITSLIYVLNQPYRSNQSLFTNISIYDKYFLDNMCPSYSLELEGKLYTADPELVNKIQEIYLDIMNAELERRILTFPITTACFSVDKDKNINDENFLDFIAKKNLKFGFINMYAGETSTHSSCCRLRSSQNNEYFNSFGSGSSKLGSLGVTTINLPRLAYKYKDNYDLFLQELGNIVEECQEINHAKRTIAKRTIKNGNLPLYSLGYMDLSRQYSTIGIVGLYECLEELGYDITQSEGVSKALEIINLINSVNEEMQGKFKAPMNCEQIPAETCSIKLADKDRFLGYQDKYELYSNQFVPLTKQCNLLDRIKVQSDLDMHFSGGSICHLNIDQRITDKDKMKSLILSAAKQGVIYFAINYALQRCKNNHTSVGNIKECPICQAEITDTYLRVVGFLANTKNWAKKRREVDLPNRVWYEGV